MAMAEESPSALSMFSSLFTSFLPTAYADEGKKEEEGEDKDEGKGEEGGEQKEDGDDKEDEEESGSSSGGGDDDDEEEPEDVSGLSSRRARAGEELSVPTPQEYPAIRESAFGCCPGSALRRCAMLVQG